MSETVHRCGVIGIVGRPNVGKSTLLNRLIGQKISITSRKPQTTRQRVTGIRTDGCNQIVFVDTPGIQTKATKVLNRTMNREALGTLADVDAIIFVVQGGIWNEADEHVLKKLGDVTVPVLLAINKVDRLDRRRDLLPMIEALARRYPFAEIVPISARTGDNVEALLRCITDRLPIRPHMFGEEEISDRNERFFVAEIIREKLVRLLGEELPYSTSVVIDEFEETPSIVNIAATILVDRGGQKAIVIGSHGEMLKRIGEQARHDIEKLLERKVFLKTWVKVREGWTDDPRVLRQLGMDVAK